VDGYHIYASRDGGAYAGAPLPSGWYDCPQGGAGAQPVQSVAAGTTSFYLPLDGEYRPQCVAVAAYNAVGQSPWAAVMVTEEGGMIDPTKTFVGDGYSVQYPCAYQGFNSLPVNVTDGYTYFDSPSFCDVGVNSSNEFMLAVQHITFSGQKPAATGPTLAAFLVKSLTLFAPYSLSAGTPADVKAVTLNGHSGYSFTINDGGYETGEVFLIGNDLFGVVGGGLAGDANKATIAKFVQSFQLT
jgi:hypothetical protein